jgi:acetoacetyl-CoA synthetase
MAGQPHPTRLPSATDTARTRGTNIAEFAARTYGYRSSSYLELWQWSIANLDDFWNALRIFFGVQSPSPHPRSRAGTMPHVRWFDGVHVSDVAHLFRGRPADAVAIIDAQEAAESEQQARYLTRVHERTAAQALHPQAKSPRKISATITSPRGTS